VRVSLTADPVEEVRVARQILQVLRLRSFGPELIACPTCGRCEIDLIPLANKVSEMIKEYRKPVKIAVMGCVVNGPGEAREADLGISAGRKHGIIFRKGKVVRTVRPERILEVFEEELRALFREDPP
jgi:(E)-4-hydroxy-3-methylbut-2-enyl-diphosphate synthase